MQVLGWWILLGVLIFIFPASIMVASMTLMLAGPLVSWLLIPKKSTLTIIPNKLSIFSTVGSMTVLGITKAAISCGIVPKRHGDVADRS
jgi:hypothetical protein